MAAFWWRKFHRKKFWVSFFCVASYFITFYLENFIFLFQKGGWLLISAVTCVTLNIFIEFNLIVMSFIVFLSIVSGVTIALAVGVNLFDVNYRGMATSFILMFGRIGGFAGSSLIGLLLVNMCSFIFYLYGAMLISKFDLYVELFPKKKISVLIELPLNFRLYFYLYVNKHSEISK